MAKGLGKGLSALFSDNTVGLEVENTIDERPVQTGENGAIIEIDRALVYPNPDQPRKRFDDEALEELADSIRTHGIIQPIVVVKRGQRFMIIAGERRWRASELAGLTKVPVVINKAVSEQKIQELSLIENLQREDLNPIEAANAIQQLMNEFNFTQEEVAQRLGKNRSTVANTLRLLSLTKPVLELVANGRLSAGHARTLVVLTDSAAQLKLAKAAVDNSVSVRDLERMVKAYQMPKIQPPSKPEISLELKDLVEDMQRVFGTKVSVLGNDRKGRIYIDYYTRDDLDRILEIMNKTKH